MFSVVTIPKFSLMVSSSRFLHHFQIQLRLSGYHIVNFMSALQSDTIATLILWKI